MGGMNIVDAWRVQYIQVPAIAVVCLVDCPVSTTVSRVMHETYLTLLRR